ncbi:MAG: tRNA (guanosine(37)-N1)-methyltransferase TrmD [Myxococcales bacterium]|nr:tRNA (guanosine(37)-N1)-methyltransferase TrmD [Myxococcales bacterium]
MHFHVITIFPELFDSFLRGGIFGKAIEAGAVHVNCVSPRDFTKDRHRAVDDAPYGGGSGMVMMPGPLLSAVRSLPDRPHRILLTPQGAPLTQRTAERLSTLPAMALLCGRYEGVDERVREEMDEEISLGDFVLLGGEVAAMAVMESVIRLLPGVLGNADSSREESHSESLLEYPHYTRPRDYEGRMVPEVLLSGDHEAIRRFRRQESLRRTWRRRPDLLEGATLSKEDRLFLDELRKASAGEGP